MTGDEMERAIEFILKNQADYESRQAEYLARQAEYQAEYRARQAEVDAKLAADRAETDRRIRELAAHQDRTQENLDRLSDQVGHLRGVVSVLAEGQRRGRDDIDALVKLVGGLVDGRNGGAAGG
jgi:predicted  nucleic acid-binding Zn-ribbon protein